MQTGVQRRAAPGAGQNQAPLVSAAAWPQVSRLASSLSLLVPQMGRCENEIIQSTFPNMTFSLFLFWLFLTFSLYLCLQ